MNNTPAAGTKETRIALDTAMGVINLLKSEDEQGEFWWMSDLFAYIGYQGPRQMSAEQPRAMMLGLRTGFAGASDFINVSIHSGGRGRPRSDWRLTRRGLYLFVMTCNAKGEAMDLLRVCVAVLALEGSGLG